MESYSRLKQGVFTGEVSKVSFDNQHLAMAIVVVQGMIEEFSGRLCDELKISPERLRLSGELKDGTYEFTFSGSDIRECVISVATETHYNMTGDHVGTINLVGISKMRKATPWQLYWEKGVEMLATLKLALAWAMGYPYYGRNGLHKWIDIALVDKLVGPLPPPGSTEFIDNIMDTSFVQAHEMDEPYSPMTVIAAKPGCGGAAAVASYILGCLRCMCPVIVHQHTTHLSAETQWVLKQYAAERDVPLVFCDLYYDCDRYRNLTDGVFLSYSQDYDQIATMFTHGNHSMVAYAELDGEYTDGGSPKLPEHFGGLTYEIIEIVKGDLK